MVLVHGVIFDQSFSNATLYNNGIIQYGSFILNTHTSTIKKIIPRKSGEIRSIVLDDNYEYIVHQFNTSDQLEIHQIKTKEEMVIDDIPTDHAIVITLHNMVICASKKSLMLYSLKKNLMYSLFDCTQEEYIYNFWYDYFHDAVFALLAPTNSNAEKPFTVKIIGYLLTNTHVPPSFETMNEYLEGHAPPISFKEALRKNSLSEEDIKIKKKKKKLLSFNKNKKHCLMQ